MEQLSLTSETEYYSVIHNCEYELPVPITCVFLQSIRGNQNQTYFFLYNKRSLSFISGHFFSCHIITCLC